MIENTCLVITLLLPMYIMSNLLSAATPKKKEGGSKKPKLKTMDIDDFDEIGKLFSSKVSSNSNDGKLVQIYLAAVFKMLIPNSQAVFSGI